MSPRTALSIWVHKIRLKRIEVAQLIEDVNSWCRGNGLDLEAELPSLLALERELRALAARLEGLDER